MSEFGEADMPASLMTLRDSFAQSAAIYTWASNMGVTQAEAILGMPPNTYNIRDFPKLLAKCAFLVADAMILERMEKTKDEKRD